MKRISVLALLLASALSAHAAQQPSQPPAGSNWQHVQALPIGTRIHVNAKTRHALCSLASVDAERLTCDGGKNSVFQREEITSIKLARRGRSTLVGLAIGAGAGIGIGAAIPISTSDPNPITQSINKDFKPLVRGVLVGIGGAAGSLTGSLTGLFSDFTCSTVYKAP